MRIWILAAAAILLPVACFGFLPCTDWLSDCGTCTGPKDTGPLMYGTKGLDPATVCVNTDATFSVSSVCDIDECGDPTPCRNYSFSYQWLVDNQPVMGATGTSFTIRWSSTGSHSVKCVITDTGDAVDDPETLDYETITVTALTSVTVSTTAACVGDDVVFTARGEFGSASGDIVWRQGSDIVGTGTQLTMQWDTPDIYQVSASFCGTTIQSQQVTVKPHPPECEYVCTATDGGGSCGSCSAGGNVSDIVLPVLSLIAPVVIMPDAFSGPGSGGANGFGGCNKQKLELVNACDGVLYVKYKSCGGECFVTTDAEVSAAGSTGLAFTSSLRIRKMSSTSYRIVMAAGDYYTFNLSSAAVPPFSAGPVAPYSYVDLDGRELFMGGALGGSTLQLSDESGQPWLYTFDAIFGRFIASELAPDLTTTAATYVAPGNPGAGKLATVTKLKGATVLTSTQFSYYPDGRLQKVVTCSKTTEYIYDDGTTKKITVLVKDNGTIPTIYSRTVYSYGSGFTTVTRKKQLITGLDDDDDEQTTYTFHTNGSGRPYIAEIVPPAGNPTLYEVNSEGKPTQVIDARGGYTNYEYNHPNGLLTKVTYPEVDSVRATEEYEYYHENLDENAPLSPYLRTKKDVLGNYTFYKRDWNVTDPHPWRVLAEKVSTTNPNDAGWEQIASTREYDYYETDSTDGREGMLEQVTVPGIDGSTANVTVYKYGAVDEDENPLVLPSPTSVLTQYWNGTSYESVTSSTEYDNLGRTLTTTDANGREVSYTYDDRGRPLRTIYGTGVYTENTYDGCNLVSSSDENGNVTHYGYDSIGRLEKSWTGLQSSGTPLLEYVYDAFGNKRIVKTRKGTSGGARETVYTYDQDNRVTSIVYPTGSGGARLIDSEYFQYDDSGSLLAKLVGVVENGAVHSGVITLYGYDGLGRLREVEYDHAYTADSTAWPLFSPVEIGTADVSITYYGGSGLRHEVTDSLGTSHYEYDERGRLTSYTPSTGLDSGYYVSYLYNNLGEKTLLQIKSDQSTIYDVKYDYYANGWLRKVQIGDGNNNYSDVSTVSYESTGGKPGKVGLRTRVDLANGTYTTYGYDSDPRYRTTGIGHFRSGTPLVSLGTIDYSRLGRDNVGNPLSIDDSWTYTTRGLGYDSMNRLTSDSSSTTYSYDWVGNRTDPGSFAYDEADRMTNWGTDYDFSYFSDGSLDEMRDSATDELIFGCDYYPGRGLMRTYSQPGQDDITSYWDAGSNRLRVDHGSTSRFFTYDATAGIPAVIREKEGTAYTFYIREPGGELVAMKRGGSTYYYHFDEIGSTKFLTGGSGTAVEIYEYDDLWGTPGPQSHSLDQPYQYVGRLGYYSDSSMYLMQLGVRFYFPNIARFTQRDPVYQEIDVYAYASDAPASLSDPDGLTPTFIRPMTPEDYCSWKCRESDAVKTRIREHPTKCMGKLTGDPNWPRNWDWVRDACGLFCHEKKAFRSGLFMKWYSQQYPKYPCGKYHPCNPQSNWECMGPSLTDPGPADYTYITPGHFCTGIRPYCRRCLPR